MGNLPEIKNLVSCILYLVLQSNLRNVLNCYDAHHLMQSVRKMFSLYGNKSWCISI